jgi:hypothetical protein
MIPPSLAANSSLTGEPPPPYRRKPIPPHASTLRPFIGTQMAYGHTRYLANRKTIVANMLATNRDGKQIPIVA